MKFNLVFSNLFFAIAVSAICFFAAPTKTFAAGEFKTTWKSDNPGTSASNQITIPTIVGPAYNYHVDWGDTTASSTVTGTVTHTYAAPGTYHVAITGTFPVIQFADAGDAQKLLSVDQWGTNVWGSMYDAFFGCTNLHILATDAPNLSVAGDMTYMLRGTAVSTEDLSSWDVSHISAMIGTFQDTLFNGNITTWNTGAVTDMTGLFYNDSAFNQDIGNWNVGAVTGMSAMFYSASSFNQNLSLWNVVNVTNMNGMFRNANGFNGTLAWGNKTAHVTDMSAMFLAAYAFNQDISGWDTRAVTSMTDMFAYAYDFNQNIGLWNVGAVTDMGTMLYHATSFNYSLSNWDVSHVTNMLSMLQGCTAFNSAVSWGSKVSHVTNFEGMFTDDTSFNQDVSGWDVSGATDLAYAFTGTAFNQNLSPWNVANVTTMDNIFTSSALSTTNYDAILAAWSAETLQSNVLFSAGSATYCAARAGHARLLSNFSWTITDGGINPTCRTITYTASANGSVTGTATQYLENGFTSASVTAVPNTGYRFLSWSDGQSQNPRTDANVTSDIAVSANFLAQTVSTGNTIYYNGCADPKALNYDPMARNISTMCMYAHTENPVTVLQKTTDLIAPKTEIEKPVFDFSKIKKLTKDLKFGMTSAEIKTVQDFLIAQNKGAMAQQLKTHGTTNYFGALTKSALAEWQKACGIMPAVGNFGALTRNYIKLLSAS